MAAETSILAAPAAAGGAIKTFIAANPVTVAIVGGALVGVGAYWLMNKYFNKSEEPAAAAA